MKGPRRINELTTFQKLALRTVGGLMKLWWWTLKFEVPHETLSLIEQTNEPIAIVLWHNRLFTAPALYKKFGRGRKIFALVSASKDGAWLTYLLKILGMQAIRGSSSWRGKQALSEMVDKLKEGNDIAITPDGPRGPCYDVKSGVLWVAKTTKAPFFLVGLAFSSSWRLKSWDKFFIPKPFSKVTLRCKKIEDWGDADLDDAEIARMTAFLKHELTQLNQDQE